MNRVVVSIFGGSGTGKSTLSKRLVDCIGAERAVRVPTDYFLASNPFGTLQAFRGHPLYYDWACLEAFISTENGTALTTPDYDFEHFTRLAESGGRPLIMRPIVFLDGMRPYPKANLLIYLHAPAAERKKRIRARDRIWGTRVIENWGLHQLTMKDVFRLQYPIDLQLDGLEAINSLVNKVLALLEQKGMLDEYCQ